MRTIGALERAALSVLDRERVELEYFDRLDPDFALNTYTTLLQPSGREGLPIVTLYAVPSRPMDVEPVRILGVFAESRRRAFPPAAGAPVIPSRLRPVMGGVLATDVDKPEEGRRLVVLRTTGTVEYVGQWVRAEPDPASGQHMLDVLSVVTRSVQLANAVIYFNQVLGGPEAWRLDVNVRRADRAYLTRHKPGERALRGGPDRCYDRHLQLTADLDASDEDDGAAWEVGRSLDLQLAHAYGFTERLGHDAGGQLHGDVPPEL